MAKVIAGNWKMNHGPDAARDFFAAFRPVVQSPGDRVVFFPPSVSLAACLESAAA